MKLLPHIHLFNTPIVSQYRSFHTRNIVFECRCGKRKVIEVTKKFGDPFPIETTILITDDQMSNMLNKPPDGNREH